MTTTFHRNWRAGELLALAHLSACRNRLPRYSQAAAMCDRLGKPLIVHSAYCSLEHNRAVVRATRSKHLDGVAFDMAITNRDPVTFEPPRTLRKSLHS